MSALGGLIGVVPIRAKGVTECAAPLFHSLGFAHAMLATWMGSALVIRRRFDARATMESLALHRASVLVVVPVMLDRLVELGPEARADKDLSSLRVIFVAGSQLGADLCVRAMDAFGPVLYNIYGSTEVAYATVATPADLAVEPGCVGRVIRGSTVKILDLDGVEMPPGVTGRIFVGNGAQFERYTGGGTKERIRGLMSSGDLGHFDERQLLFIDGRDDEMIVSGGENVFPREVEELLQGHGAVREVAAVGVPDAAFGTRLRAFVVVTQGASVTEDDLKNYVHDNLARYKVPRDIVFLTELPRNPTGKVMKRVLAQLEINS
jgi:fatty-acyl-CoA synthase